MSNLRYTVFPQNNEIKFSLKVMRKYSIEYCRPNPSLSSCVFGIFTATIGFTTGRKTSCGEPEQFRKSAQNIPISSQIFLVHLVNLPISSQTFLVHLVNTPKIYFPDIYSTQNIQLGVFESCNGPRAA